MRHLTDIEKEQIELGLGAGDEIMHTEEHVKAGNISTVFYAIVEQHFDEGKFTAIVCNNWEIEDLQEEIFDCPDQAKNWAIKTLNIQKSEFINLINSI